MEILLEPNSIPIVFSLKKCSTTILDMKLLDFNKNAKTAQACKVPVARGGGGRFEGGGGGGGGLSQLVSAVTPRLGSANLCPSVPAGILRGPPVVRTPPPQVLAPVAGPAGGIDDPMRGPPQGLSHPPPRSDGRPGPSDGAGHAMAPQPPTPGQMPSGVPAVATTRPAVPPPTTPRRT